MSNYYKGASSEAHLRIECHPDYGIFFPSVIKNKHAFPMWKADDIANFFGLYNYNSLLWEYGAVKKGAVDKAKGIRLGKHLVFETEEACQHFITEVLEPKLLSIIMTLS